MRLLRCVLESKHIVTVRTVDGNFAIMDSYVRAPVEPGLGITIRKEVLVEAIACYQ